MAGRGENNKHGSAGCGAGNQSNQPFGQDVSRSKSNHGEQTGGKPSEPQDKTKDTAAHRNMGKTEEKL